MPNVNDSLQDQLLQTWKIKSRHRQGVPTAPQNVVSQTDDMFQYVRNAEFQAWLQRATIMVITCVLTSILLWQVCLLYHPLQVVLFGFFKWLLIPVKPLLIAAPSPAASGLMSLLTGLSNFVNVIIAPVACLLAIKASEAPKLIHLHGGRLYVLSPGTFSSQDWIDRRAAVLNINRLVYPVLQVIDLNEATKVSLIRPHGKKSIKDYILTFQTPQQAPLKLRWGDIIKPHERSAFFQQLEERFPDLMEPAAFEPFRPMIARQSYTELWLRELSDAPKRDKLTPLTAGTTLDGGNYTIINKAGMGGQGTAYFAESIKHTCLGHNQVVLKEYVLPVYPDVRVRRKAAERFQSEAEILKRLHHPQIAKFVDLFVEDHRAYVVMELVEGRTLKDLVAAEGPLNEAGVLDIAAQILEILSYLHKQSPPVIHRDLTPDNIIMGSDGMIKLIDFSVAQEVSSGVTGSVVGKPNYISPEQFRGKPATQSDIYSLGATMFYLLVGRDPSPISVSHPKTECDAISTELDDVVARCTQTELSKRYESAEKVLESIRLLPQHRL
jgi:tRNA A-37 threonylcarbamoyl transferase component Bud32